MSELEYSKRGKRVLSEFMGRHLLYDFNHEKLDPERSQGLVKLINSSPDTQRELESLNLAEDYLDAISQWPVPERVRAQLGRSPNLFEVFSQKIRFSEWPEGLKMGLELTVILGFMCAGLMLVPWDRLIMNRHGQSHLLQLAQIDHAKDHEFEESPVPDDGSKSKAIAAKPEAPAPTIESKADTTKTVAKSENAKATPTPVQVAHVTAPAPPVAPAVPPTPQTAAKIPAQTPPSPPATPAAEQVASAVSTEPTVVDDNQKPAPRVGYLYRGTFFVDDLDAVTEKYVEIISGMGGKKAGEVKLGWRKDNGTYFHFTLPSNKLEALTDMMKQEGRLVLQKEKHERIMPQGTERLIITFTQNHAGDDEKK